MSPPIGTVGVSRPLANSMASRLFSALLSAALPVVTRALVTKHIFHVAAQDSTTLSYHDTAVSIHLMNHHDKSAELTKIG